MLKTILSISGKPGLYKLISRGKNMLIVESVTDKKRFPAYGSEKIISLGDIAIYTQEDEVPLRQVLIAIRDKENGAAIEMDIKKLLLISCVITWKRFCRNMIRRGYM